MLALYMCATATLLTMHTYAAQCRHLICNNTTVFVMHHAVAQAEEARAEAGEPALLAFVAGHGHGVPEQRPENSVYYHPTLNPSGTPPPGKPQRYRTALALPAPPPAAGIPVPKPPPLPKGPAPARPLLVSDSVFAPACHACALGPGHRPVSICGGIWMCLRRVIT